jgi:hypothetical protein
MRFFALLWLCLASLVGQTAPSQTGGEAQTNQQKARAVIDKMIATMGGPAYLNLQDSYSEGRYGRFHNEAMVGGAEYFRYWQWPDKDRWELTKERDIVTLYLGDKVYEVTFRGATQLNPQKDDNLRLALARRHYALENVLRVWLNAAGTALLDEGPTLAENRMAERITIINANDEAVTLLVSTDSHLPVQKIFSLRDPQTRERDEEIEVYDNWKMMQGINTPFSVLLKHNGEIARQQFLSSITYNTHPPESYFTPILIKRAQK